MNYCFGFCLRSRKQEKTVYRITTFLEPLIKKLIFAEQKEKRTEENMTMS